MKTWFSLCVSKPVVRRAAITALIVGLILTVINHGDALLRGQVDAARAWRIALTVTVPYLVSTFSSVATLIEIQEPHNLPGRIA
jgi:hypothetical protein